MRHQLANVPGGLECQQRGLWALWQFSEGTLKFFLISQPSKVQGFIKGEGTGQGLQPESGHVDCFLEASRRAHQTSRGEGVQAEGILAGEWQQVPLALQRPGQDPATRKGIW